MKIIDERETQKQKNKLKEKQTKKQQKRNTEEEKGDRSYSETVKAK